MASSTLVIIALVCLVTATAFDPRNLFRSQDNNQPQNHQDSRNQDSYGNGNQDTRYRPDNQFIQDSRTQNTRNQDSRNEDSYVNENNRGYPNNGRQNHDLRNQNTRNQDSRNEDSNLNENHRRFQNNQDSRTQNTRNQDSRNEESNLDENNRRFQNNQDSRNQNTRNQDSRNEDSNFNENNRRFQNTGRQDSRNQNTRNQDSRNQNTRNQDSRNNENEKQTVNRNQDSSNTKDGDSSNQGQGQESTTSKNILKKIGKGIEKEIQDIKQPVLAGVVSVASSQCDNLKKIAGVAYEQLDDEDEPDVSQLTLRFISGSYNITYNITTAARDIPSARNHDPSQRLYIFLHGFTDDPTKTSYSTIRKALFNEGKCNVLGLDASSLIKWLYLRSTTYVQFIGEKLGEVLAALVQGGVDRSNIHIIGHSLGAHIAGFTGKQFLRLTGSRVGRISGLDPAGPCFAHVNDSQRLNATDADFVDAIHTDSGVYGIKEAVGQVDYYPNEGKSQPGCFFETCSHSRAVQLFADSIENPTSFPAVRCDSWEQFEKGLCQNERSLMGLGSKPGTRGQFYLQTGSEAPFGRGDEGTLYRDKKGVVKTITKLLG